MGDDNKKNNKISKLCCFLTCLPVFIMVLLPFVLLFGNVNSVLGFEIIKRCPFYVGLIFIALSIYGSFTMNPAIVVLIYVILLLLLLFFIYLSVFKNKQFRYVFYIFLFVDLVFNLITGNFTGFLADLSIIVLFVVALRTRNTGNTADGSLSSY